MQIRPADSKDYDQLTGLLRQLNPSDPEAPEVEFKVFREIVDSKYLDLIVAEDKDILVGSCYLNVIPNMTRGGRPYAIIENVITDSAHRKRGIGKALIERALEMAWQQNCYKVMLLSGRKQEGVHAFYRQCGFDADEKQAYVQRAP